MSSPTQNIAPKTSNKTKKTYANWTGSRERDRPSHHHWNNHQTTTTATTTPTHHQKQPPLQQLKKKKKTTTTPKNSKKTNHHHRHNNHAFQRISLFWSSVHVIRHAHSIRSSLELDWFKKGLLQFSFWYSFWSSLVKKYLIQH